MSGIMTNEYIDDMLSKYLIQDIKSKLKDKYLNNITLKSIRRFINHYKDAQEFFITLNIKRES